MQRKDRIKIATLTLFIAVLLGALLTGEGTVRTAQAFSVGPNPGHTGAPFELTCAVDGCHGGDPNTGPGLLQIIAPSLYEPGHTYEITVKHTTPDTTRRRWGFQLTALDASNRKAGELINLSGLTQVLEGGPSGDRQYIEHNFLGTFQGQPLEASWNFSWVAPSSDVGPVIIYAAGNQANNDGNNTGDQIYTATAYSFSGPPRIESAQVGGKKLILSGSNFGGGATLFMDGDRVKKVFNDEENPTTVIVARKAGKLIAPGQTVMLKIVNPGGTESEEFPYTRPQE